jgi:protein-S-isoprenylcysteine O-methyltransferase Ste14
MPKVKVLVLIMSTVTFKSYTLVFIQFAMLLMFALTGPWFARGVLWLLLEGLGGLLGAWGVWTMRIDNFNIRPEVKATSRLVRNGPYRWIRHPMYSAVLLVTLGLLLDRFSLWRLLCWVILLVDLVIKLYYEERLLTAHFDDYATYCRQTKRLLFLVY